MSDIQCLADSYRQQVKTFQGHLADFSEAEMVKRPCPAANHAAWQIGHLVNAVTNLVNMAVPGTMPALDPDFAAKYGKTGAKADSGFHSKAELLGHLEKVNNAAADWALKLTDADKAKPMPPQIQGFCKTVGDLLQTLPQHAMMHLGQIQVIRRSLGKPHLF